MVTTDPQRPTRSVRRRTVVRPTVPADDPAAVEAAPVEEARKAKAPAAGRRSRLVAWALLIVLAAVLVGGGLLGRRWYDQRQLAEARSQALAAARQTCVNFVSISASTVDSDLKRIADGATGQFKDEFTQDTAQVKAAVVQNKVDSHGTVLRAGVVSADRHSAVILVAVDATVKNASAPDGRLSHYRIQVNMARDAASGRWLVAQLQFVG
jgi:Mce-associated membrane protein